jgi:2-succinyl-5-enolpyruvyl-6-hydroxy-3-cyclohexene-1-carboxylate synthase
MNNVVHYANSTAIRLANTYAHSTVFCNRGVNGIEGSLSTAAGFSLVADEKVFCVIGDLSFFYDQNALWNQNLRGNLRILLLNNGHGAIFDTLPGLSQSPARDRLVAAAHATTAEGICRQNNVTYLKATNMAEMQQAVDTLLYIESDRPVLLEVFVD